MSEQRFIKPTPLEALHHCVLMSAIGCYSRKPGSLIAAMPKEIREALRGLTSDMTRRLRP